ncbi:MAG TPA: response regulator transcription factor, partial [Caldilineaceae bacterium]|nr:response regulator transcription factor [Caldilineaceae bacterium]
ILLADDHAVVRQGIHDFLTADGDVVIIAETDDGEEAWRLIQREPPDVAILDIRMPGLNGIELTRRVKLHFPQVRVLILTAYDDEPYVLTLLRAGVDGYLLKTAKSNDLLCTVKRVAAGQQVIDPDLAPLLIASLTGPRQLEPLSQRELEVVRGVARGWSNREIGQALAISQRTVQGHLANVFGKLQANSRTEVMTVALQQGLIRLDEIPS